MRIPTLFLAACLAVSAQETMIREVADPKTDTHVEVLALFSEPSRGGYFPVRVKIANNLNADRSIRLDFNSSSGFGSGVGTKSSFAFSAPAGKAVTTDIMVPLCPSPSTYAEEQVVSVEMSGSLGRASNSIRCSTNHAEPAVLLSEALFTPNASLLDAEVTKKSGSRYGNSTFASKFDPRQLPSDWLAFSGFDSILMTDTDWTKTPAGARNAILSWVRLGGQLVVYATSAASPPSLGLPADAGYGSCLLKNVGSDLKLSTDEVLATVDSGNPVSKRLASTRGDHDGVWPLQSLFGGQAFNYGLFIAVLIVFGILVGPVNLFVLAKSGQRHRLFITTPLISLAASLLLVALIIFQDGFGGRGVRLVLMEARPDSGQNAAFIHQEQISRTGILTASRFTVDPACLMQPVPIAKSRWSRYTSDYGTSGSFNLQPAGAGMEASGDWWQSRSEHGHALSAVLPSRGRIEKGPGNGQFVSTFDFPLEVLYFRDASNQWHRAESIRTGQPFTAEPVASTTAEEALANEANRFASRNRNLLNRAKNRTGHFVAVATAAPGIDTHPGIRWQETRTLITGPIPLAE